MHRVSHYLRTVFAFVCFAVGGSIMSWIVLPLVYVSAGRDREVATRRCQSTLQASFRVFLRMLAAMRLFKTQWRLSESRVPPEPCVIICNHPCLLDTVTMVARYDHVICLVKQSYFESPFFYGLAAFCGYIPAGRDNSVVAHQKMIEHAVDRLRRGYSVLAFPECRRTPLGQRLPFRRGPFEIAARAGVPILPVKITCSPRILTREEPIHRMPAVCASYSIRELPMHNVQPGRDATKAAARAIDDLLQSDPTPPTSIEAMQPPLRPTAEARTVGNASLFRS